jgi:hypothetical protein
MKKEFKFKIPEGQQKMNLLLMAASLVENDYTPSQDMLDNLTDDV